MSIDIIIDGLGKVAEFLNGTSQEVIDTVMRRDLFTGQMNKPQPQAQPQPGTYNPGMINAEGLMGRLLPGAQQQQTPSPSPKPGISTTPLYQKGLRAKATSPKHFELFKKSYPDTAREIEYQEDYPINPRELAEAVEPITRSFRQLGYSTNKGINEGMAAFSNGLHQMADYVAAKTGWEKGDIFKRAAETFNNNKKYWQEKAKEEGTGPVAEFLGEVAGGAGPGIGDFMLGPVAYAVKGAANAHTAGQNEVLGALKGAMERGMMGKLMHTFARLTTAPRAGMTGVLFEEQARGEGEKDPRKLAKAGATGMVFGLPGQGGVRVKDLIREAKNLEAETLAKGRAMDQKKSSVIGDERGALKPALMVDGKVYTAGSNHGDIYGNVPTEALEKAQDIQTGYQTEEGKWVTDKEAREQLNKSKSLVPAVRHEGNLYTGEVGDRHPEVMKRNNIGAEADHERGFVGPDGKFMTRAQAKQWMKRERPGLYKEWVATVEGEGETVKKPLHSEDLNTAQGLPEKPGTSVGMGLGAGADLFAKGKGFRSNTADEIKKETAAAMPAQEWGKRIRAWGQKYKGVGEENKWSGVLEWLEGRKGDKKVTKDEMLQFMEASKGGWLEEVQPFGDRTGDIIPELTRSQKRRLRSLSERLFNSIEDLDTYPGDVNNAVVYAYGPSPYYQDKFYLSWRWKGRESGGGANYTAQELSNTFGTEIARQVENGTLPKDAVITMDDPPKPLKSRKKPLTDSEVEEYNRLLEQDEEYNRREERHFPPDPWAGYNIPGGIPGTEKVFAFRIPGKVKQETTKLEFPSGTREVTGPGEGHFQSSHFPNIPDVVFHIRTHKMKDKDGNVGLVAETIQSDWHQEAKELGYRDAPPTHEEVDRAKKMIRSYNPHLSDEVLFKDLSDEEIVKEVADFGEGGSRKLPLAPFSTTWHEAALKHVIDMAAKDKEVKWIGWPSGKVQMERWGKRGGEEPWEGAVGVMPIDEKNWIVVDEYGEDVSGVVFKTEKEANDAFKSMQSCRHAGIDFLEVLYDSKLPKFAKPYAKKLGGSYRTDEITSINSRTQELVDLASKQRGYERHSPEWEKLEDKIIWLMDKTGGEITPKMLEDAERQGGSTYGIHRVDMPDTAKKKVRTEGQTFYMGVDPTKIISLIRKNPNAAQPHIKKLGTAIYGSGIKDKAKWTKEMQTNLGDMWNVLKPTVEKVWGMIPRRKEEDE